MSNAEFFYRLKFFFRFDAFGNDIAIERRRHALNGTNEIKFDLIGMQAVDKVFVYFDVLGQQFRPEP